MLLDIVRSLLRIRPKPDKELYVMANKAARRRIQLMEAVAYLEQVKTWTPSAKAYGQITLAWRLMKDAAPGNTELVYCALKLNDILVNDWSGSIVTADVVSLIKNLVRRIEAVTFVTPPAEVHQEIAA